jgi:RNA polymerase sigma-70 factor (sigma-E family)
MTAQRDAALVAFCERMYPRLVGTLALQCGDAEVAQEIAQEALTRAWQHWPRVSRYDSPEAWVFRVALNLSTSRFRRATRERRALVEVAAIPEAGGADATDRIAIRAAVLSLPPRQRAALVLRFFADLPVDEVARAMDCAPGTVKSLTAKAIDSLRTRLGREIEEDARHDGHPRATA